MKKNHLIALVIAFLILAFPFRWAYMEMELPMIQRLGAFLVTLLGFAIAGSVAGASPRTKTVKAHQPETIKVNIRKPASNDHYITAH